MAMSRILAACLAVPLSCAALADAPGPPPVPGGGCSLMDPPSGQPIGGGNPEERIEPASLTKLMTAYLAFAALRGRSLAPGQTVPVSERAWRAAGSRMFIEPRKPVTVQELLRGMIVQSGNDACIALAEAIAGSESAFVERMNREARRLGMKNTNFANSTGLPDPGHYSTAGDLALLAAALISDYPEHYKLYSEREYRDNDITQQNRNRLPWLDPKVGGVKTRPTESARYRLLASAKRGARRLVSVVIGSPSERLRARESQQLLDFGFQSYDGVRHFPQGHAISKLKVQQVIQRELQVGVAADLYVTVPRGPADRRS